MSFAIRPFTLSDQPAVIALWRECGLVRPQNDPVKDIARKLKVNPELFLVAVSAEGHVVGSVMAGYEGRRGWINFLGVAASMRRQGVGRALIADAETRLRALGCPKINLQVRSDNTGVIQFYEKLGFAVEHLVSMGRRLEAD